MDNLLNISINNVAFTVLDVETTGLETYLGHRMCVWRILVSVHRNSLYIRRLEREFFY